MELKPIPRDQPSRHTSFFGCEIARFEKRPHGSPAVGPPEAGGSDLPPIGTIGMTFPELDISFSACVCLRRSLDK